MGDRKDWLEGLIDALQNKKEKNALDLYELELAQKEYGRLNDKDTNTNLRI